MLRRFPLAGVLSAAGPTARLVSPPHRCSRSRWGLCWTDIALADSLPTQPASRSAFQHTLARAAKSSRPERTASAPKARRQQTAYLSMAAASANGISSTACREIAISLFYHQEKHFPLGKNV